MPFRQHVLCFVVAVAFLGGVHAFGISGGGTFDSFLLALQPETTRSVSPAWMAGEAVVDKETQTVEVPIAPLWLHSGPEAYAVKVVFQDDGDGGPAVEWRNDAGESTVLSHGLGGIGTAVGLNSRTVLVPKPLAREGGALLVSYYGNFDAMVSLAVVPLREDLVAVAGMRSAPSLIDSNHRVSEERDVNGSRPIPLGGDLWKGNIVEAELASETEQLEDALEFAIPIQGEMEGAMLHLESLGLDPAAKIQIIVNSEAIGTVNIEGFQLDDPSLVMDWNGKLIYAGWRRGSLFLPVDKLRQGDNSVVLTLERSSTETGRDVFLRNAGIHIRFRHIPGELTIDFDPSTQGFPPNSNEIDFSFIDPILSETFPTSAPDSEDSELPEGETKTVE
jgi:hypothetical protein